MLQQKAGVSQNQGTFWGSLKEGPKYMGIYTAVPLSAETTVSLSRAEKSHGSKMLFAQDKMPRWAYLSTKTRTLPRRGLGFRSSSICKSKANTQADATRSLCSRPE